jgi:hypothetical protein
MRRNFDHLVLNSVAHGLAVRCRTTTPSRIMPFLCRPKNLIGNSTRSPCVLVARRSASGFVDNAESKNRAGDIASVKSVRNNLVVK